MKKVIFGLIATVLMISLSTASEINNPIADGSVEVTLKIGRKSRGCAGFGICKVEKVKVVIKNLSLRQQSEEKLVKAKLSSINGKIILSVDEENLNIVKENFKDMQLVIEESYEIEDAEILKELSVERISIKEGVYKFTQNVKNSNYELYL
jgi:hypothetical protein